MAEYLGAKLNPKFGYENDVCIYVKPYFQKNQNPKDDIKFEGRPYLDMVDGHNLAFLAKRHPEVTVITCSKVDMELMKKEIPNKVIFIPQHHCNYKNKKRNRSVLKKVGVIGTQPAFAFLPKDLKSELAKRDMELIEFSRFFKRQDIIDFYLNIDLQIVWRPYKKIMSNPLKLVNAASFGVPTIALDEPTFMELDGCYVPVNNFETFLKRLDILRESPKAYFTLTYRCLEKAKEYHIKKVGEMYKELDK